MKCPSCHGLTEKDGKSCSCGWRAQATKQHAQKRICEFDDHGQQCGYEGRLSTTTMGEGPWYCRAHFARIMGWPQWEAGTYFAPIKAKP
jgi:hypothetical protein